MYQPAPATCSEPNCTGEVFADGRCRKCYRANLKIRRIATAERKACKVDLDLTKYPDVFQALAEAAELETRSIPNQVIALLRERYDERVLARKGGHTL